MTLAMAALVRRAAHAGLFDDDEARKAILDMRQRIDQSNEQSRARHAEQMPSRSTSSSARVFELNTQLEQMRVDDGEAARPGRAARARRLRVAAQAEGHLARRRRAHPQDRAAEGHASTARNSSPSPRRSASTRRRSQAVAQGRVRRRAGGADGASCGASRRAATRDSALFWLGNAQYGLREYKEAISSFRTMVSNAPDQRAGARGAARDRQLPDRAEGHRRRRASTIEELMKAYPKSEAAQAGRERLASLR